MTCACKAWLTNQRLGRGGSRICWPSVADLAYAPIPVLTQEGSILPMGGVIAHDTDLIVKVPFGFTIYAPITALSRLCHTTHSPHFRAFQYYLSALIAK